MQLAFTKTRSSLGIDAKSVSVEVHLSNGLPNFTIVGLAETTVKESKDRVRSAILASQFEFPCRKIVVNLAPADLPKSGGGFDLPIAIGILAASNQITKDKLLTHEFMGELALNGALRSVPSIIPSVLAAQQDKHNIIIPLENSQQAALVNYDQIFSSKTLKEVCDYLNNTSKIDKVTPINVPQRYPEDIDWSDIKGQYHAKQALEIAACGGHNVLLIGPPGSGKSMLAKRFPTLLPELTEKQALESVTITSLRGKLPNFTQWRLPPFRSPHHTASPVSLVGGSNPPKPGEISLAHQGVLFLDELPEFDKKVLETLREPLETGYICISRAAIQMEFPCQFQLISAMNPCPCGHSNNPNANCLCTPVQINRYHSKLSGPLLDRIDIHIHVQALTREELLKPLTISPSQTSVSIREKVKQVRDRQYARQGSLNANLLPKECEKHCDLGKKEEDFLHKVLVKLKLSGRGYYRLLKIARTIADKYEQDKVSVDNLQEALSYKQMLNSPK